jgi:hypothetical protein
MKTWQEFTIAERREEAEQRMPPLMNTDNPRVNLRKVHIERAVLGIHRVTDSQLEKICEKGYDVFLIDEMNQSTSLGSKRYQQLISINRIDLTSEYIAFHNFRKKLKQPARMKIAKLMADYYSKHPLKE